MTSRVMMDTNFWIHLKNNPETYQEFRRRLDNNKIEVLFSAGNFIDLLKAQEQDQLSKIIAETADLYLPLQSGGNGTYEFSEDPAVLIPTPTARQEFAHLTRILDDDLALQFVFRRADWENPDEYFEMTEEMRNIYEKFGFENSMGYLFREYLEENGEQLLLHQEDIDPVEFIRGMLELHRIKQMKESEIPDGNDFADMEICSHAIVTECDCLFIEKKWIEKGVIESVVERLTLDGPTLYKDYDVFFSEFHTEAE